MLRSHIILHACDDKQLFLNDVIDYAGTVSASDGTGKLSDVTYRGAIKRIFLKEKNDVRKFYCSKYGDAATAFIDGVRR
ncbi:MAG: hypothetical protein ACXWJK_17310 [Burkholderiaceae bacterium]